MIAWPKPVDFPEADWTEQRADALSLANSMYARGVAYELMWTDFVTRVELQSGRQMPELRTYIQIARLADGTVDMTNWTKEQRENIHYLMLFSEHKHIEALVETRDITRRIADIQKNKPVFFYYLAVKFGVTDASLFEKSAQQLEEIIIRDVWVGKFLPTPKINEYQTYIVGIRDVIADDPRPHITDEIVSNARDYPPDVLALWTDLTRYPTPADAVAAAAANTADSADVLQLYATFSVFQALLPYKQRMEDINELYFDTDIDKFTNPLMEAYIPDILENIATQMKIKHNNLVNDALLNANTPSTPDDASSTTGGTSSTGSTESTGSTGSTDSTAGSMSDDDDDDEDSTPSPPPDPLSLPIPVGEQAAYDAEYNELLRRFAFYYEENRQIAQLRGKSITSGVQSAYQKLHVPLDFNEQKSTIDARMEDARDTNDTLRTNLISMLDTAVAKTPDVDLADEWAITRALDRPDFYGTYRQVIATRLRIDEARYALIGRKVAAYGKQLETLARLGALVSPYQTFVTDIGRDGGLPATLDEAQRQKLDDYEARLNAIENGLIDLVASHKPADVDDPQWEAEKNSEVPDFLKFYVKYARADIAEAFTRNVENQKRRYIIVDALLSQLALRKETDRIDELVQIDTDKFDEAQLEEFANELGRYENEIYVALNTAIENAGNYALIDEFNKAVGAQAPTAAQLDYFYREHIRTQAAIQKPTDQMVIEYQNLVQMALRMGFEFEDETLESSVRAIADDETLVTGTRIINDLRALMAERVQQYATDIDTQYFMAGTDALNVAIGARLALDEQYAALQTEETRQNLMAQNASTLAAENVALDALYDNDVGPLPEPQDVIDIPAAAECLAELRLERDAPLQRLNDELTPNDRNAVLRANPALLNECEELASVNPMTDAECKDALVKLYTLKAKVDTAIQTVAASPYRNCRSYLKRFEEAFGDNAALESLTETDVKEAALDILNETRLIMQLAKTQERSTVVNESFGKFVQDMAEYRAFQKTRDKLRDVSKEIDEHIAPSARDAFYTLIGYANQPASGLDATLEFNELEQNTTAAYNAFRKTFDDKLLEANMERECLRTLVGYRQLVTIRNVTGDAKIDELMQQTRDITVNDVEQTSEELFDDIIEAANEKEAFLKRERENLDKLLAPIREFNAMHPDDPDAEVAKQIEAQKTFIRQLAIYARADPPRPL